MARSDTLPIAPSLTTWTHVGTVALKPGRLARLRLAGTFLCTWPSSFSRTTAPRAVDETAKLSRLLKTLDSSHQTSDVPCEWVPAAAGATVNAAKIAAARVSMVRIRLRSRRRDKLLIQVSPPVLSSERPKSSAD